MKNTNNIKMSSGALIPQIIAFAIPLVLSGILQLLFNAADIVVVGQFSGYQSMAAVGATAALANLIFNLFMGLSVGVSVLVAQYYGAENDEGVSRTVHTAIVLSVICGIIVAAVGFFLARPMLEAMDTPDEILDLAVLYIKIYFLGAPVSLLYNFGAAILRAVGNTKQPLYYLVIAGVLNVILNLFFVIVLQMGVAGVACATVISQTLSAVLVVRRLMQEENSLKLVLSKLGIDRSKLKRILAIGIPAGISSMTFSISNIIIQSSLNSFDNAIIVAGNTAAGSLEGFIFAAMTAFDQASLTFTGQNVGAGTYHRIRKVIWDCTGLVTVVAVLMGVGAILLDTELLALYNPDPVVIQYGKIRLFIIAGSYFLCGIMNVLVGVLRGMGSVMVPTVLVALGTIGVRFVWIYTAFAQSFERYSALMTQQAQTESLQVLFLSYPVSWTFIVVALIPYLIYRMKKLTSAPKENILQ